MAKPKRAPKKRQRVPNEKFGRQNPVPFKDVVERLLQTPPDKVASGRETRRKK